MLQEGSRDCIIDLGPKLQDFHLVAFHERFWTQQELIARGITAWHLAVLQVPFPHQIFCDELPGISKDEVPSSIIDAQTIQGLPDLLLRDAVAIHVDDTQKRHQKAILRQPPLTSHRLTVAEI